MSSTNTIQEYQENKTIFVNGLPPQVGESELYKMVTEIAEGKVVTVHINRDQNKYETSIAYINMISHEAAKEVINKMNGRIIHEKKINVAWSMKDYKLRTQNETNLVIKGIKKEITQQTIQEVFSHYGEVLSVKLSTNKKNESNGYCYCKFVEVEEVEKAIAAQEELKTKIGTESFVVERYVKQPPAANTNLYVGNIDKQITEEQFVKYFENFGEIRVDPTGKKLYDFVYVEKYDKYRGYVNFVNQECAEKALQAPKANVLGEGELVVAYYKKRADRHKEWKQQADEKKANINGKFKEFNLYINTKQPVISEEEVKAQLEDCGMIYSLKVKWTKAGQTGIAYVCFTDAESAQKATTKCKSIGWECNKLISKHEKVNQGFHYHQMPSYMYPINYFQYLSLVPHSFYKYAGGGRPNVSKSNGQKKGGDRKRKEPQQVQKPVEQPKKVEVTEEMKNDLGDKLYDYIFSMKYGEELTGRITGVLLESLEYEELKKKLEQEQEELKEIINEVKNTLETM